MGGDGPQKNFRWEDGPCIRPPNIWRSSVIGSVAKYEKAKKEPINKVVKDFTKRLKACVQVNGGDFEHLM